MHMNLSIRLLIPLIFIAPYVKAELIIVTNEDEFNNHVLQCDKPCIVKFAADWCGVCQGVKKPFEELAEDKDLDNIQFVRINIDDAAELSKKHEIGGVPTFIFIVDGNKVDQEVGVQNVENFKDNMRQNLQKRFPKTIQTNIDANADQKQSPEERKAQAEGVLDTILNFLRWLAISIIEAFMYLIDAIKGAFQK